MERQLRKAIPQFKNYYSRECLVKSAPDPASRTFRGVLATEEPAIVADWYHWRMIREVLLVDGMEVPDKMKLLDAHSRFSTIDIMGSTKNPEKMYDESIGKIWEADNEFSKTAEKQFTLAEEGHLDSTSIGYEVFPEYSIELKPGEQKEVEGKLYKNDYADKLPLVIRTKSRVFENSLVPIGADKFAKFRSMLPPEDLLAENDAMQRSISETKDMIEVIRQETKELDSKVKIIINNISKQNNFFNQKEQVKMDEEKKLQEQQRVDAINKLAEKFAGKVNGVDLMDAAELYKASGKSEREFADMIFENQKQQAAVAGPTVHLSEKELKIYNPANAVRSLVNKTNSLEREVSDQYAKNSGISPAGIFIPHNAVLPKMRTGRRDLTAGTANSAAELVGTDHLGAQFIDYLYEKMVLDNITFLPNRKGNVEIPVLSASAGHGWAATEVTAVAEGAPTTTERTASPKRGGRFIEMTKQLMIQSDPDAESLFVNDLLKSLAIGIQNAVLNGTGASGQPTGVKLTSGIGSVGSLASMDFDKAVLFETLIDDAFGDGNGMYFVTRRAHSGALKTRKIDAGSGRFVNENNVINGYGVRTTNLVADGDMFFGDWTNIIVPLWDGVDLVFDPYTKAAEGMVKVTANQLLDIIVRYPSAFSYGSSFS